MEADEELLKRVRDSYERIGRPKHLVCALSGGADSVCLLLLLCELKKQTAFQLRCLHVNHGLRAASGEEEFFVRRLCEKHKVPLRVEHPGISRQGNLEANAREARLRAYEKALEGKEDGVVALAHHADDQAETLLMHLMRGCGGAGLAGMRELRGRLWRPLLGTGREEILALLEREGASWVEDDSNRDPRFLRNALRHGVLPSLRALAPRSVINIARTAELLAEEEEYWSGFCLGWLRGHASVTGPCPFVLAEPCACLPAAAQRRVLRALGESLGLTMDRRQTESLRDLLSSPAGASVNLPGGGLALRTRDRLHLTLPREGAARPPGQLVRVDDRDLPGDGRRLQALDADALRGAALRLRRPGDRITPLNGPGSRSLGKYLNDRGVDRPFRAFLPLVARGSEVLWVIGVGVAQTAALTRDTRSPVLLRYDGRLPWDTEADALSPKPAPPASPPFVVLPAADP